MAGNDKDDPDDPSQKQNRITNDDRHDGTKADKNKHGNRRIQDEVELEFGIINLPPQRRQPPTDDRHLSTGPQIEPKTTKKNQMRSGREMVLHPEVKESRANLFKRHPWKEIPIIDHKCSPTILDEIKRQK